MSEDALFLAGIAVSLSLMFAAGLISSAIRSASEKKENPPSRRDEWKSYWEPRTRDQRDHELGLWINERSARRAVEEDIQAKGTSTGGVQKC